MAAPGNVYLVELDTKPILSFTFEDTDLSIYDTIVLRMRRPDGTKIERDATIDNATTGVFHFTWEDGDLVPGVSEMEIIFTELAGGVLTFPSDAPLKAIVRQHV